MRLNRIPGGRSARVRAGRLSRNLLKSIVTFEVQLSDSGTSVIDNNRTVIKITIELLAEAATAWDKHVALEVGTALRRPIWARSTNIRHMKRGAASLINSFAPSMEGSTS